MASLDEIILKELGQDEGKKVYNFICEEFRRFEWHFYENGIEADETSYKKLMYECYKCINDFLIKENKCAGFSWKRYEKAMEYVNTNNFIKMKLELNEDISFLINKTISEFYKKNKDLIKLTSLAYSFCVVAYNVLKSPEFFDIGLFGAANIETT
ncbi:MAG: hypothetical protein PHT91_03585 [Candidatus Nanoarchaeia archaeon]|nr:hypothetical protein [Candidatus Nanoarchaeia archaeon]MDD5054121.1 hypothetical protein [Candidatus Nanoarchaeia archaeon]MDD5499926.1 hypothetical protein [Candidatus Nanoarchaeia archaeon]